MRAWRWMSCGLGLAAAVSAASAQSGLESPAALARHLAGAPTARLLEAQERHERVVWAAERALALLSLRAELPEAALVRLEQLLLRTRVELEEAALLDPERRGYGEELDRAALPTLDLLHQWMGAFAAAVVLGEVRDPRRIPMPAPEVVCRFLEAGAAPALTPFGRHARLVGLRFLDRLGHSELALGQLAFARLPAVDRAWRGYEASDGLLDPTQGLPGETGAQVAAVLNEYASRCRGAGAETLGAAGTALGRLLGAGPGVGPEPEDPAPGAEDPAPEEDREASPVTWVLALLIAVVGAKTLRDLLRPRRPAGPIEEIPVDVVARGRPPAEAVEAARVASLQTVVAPSGSVPRPVEPPPPPPPAPGDLPAWLAAALAGPLGERYRELRVLGAGGMGTVVYAVDTRLGRPVAVKVPPPHLAGQPEFRERFLREARALARLDHPSVTRIIDVPDVGEGEIPVMIMEFLEGCDLLALVEREGLPELTKLCQYMVQAAGGLDHAHAQGVHHRDVKPANLFLTRGRVKVLDFGLARAEEEGARALTGAGYMVGSVPFMPPEQIRGERVDHLADQYALAVTAFFLLTGQLPFASDDGVRNRAASPSGVRPGLAPQLDAVFQRALHPEPAARYASCTEFARALLKAAQGL